MTEIDTVPEILKHYDGPMLIERLHLIVSARGEDAVEAASAALQHLDRVGLPSPYLEQFISTVSELDSLDEKYTDPQRISELKNNRTKILKELGADSLYHETDITKIVKISQIHAYAHQYQEAQSMLASSTLGSYTCQLAEQCSQIGLLQPNHLQLTLNQDKRIESFLNTSLSNEPYLKRLTDIEVTAYWRVKFYVIYAEFLKQNYDEVSSLIYKLIRSPSIQTFTGRNISALDVLTKSNFGKFIHKDEIILISVLSILLSRPASELLQVLTEEEFVSLVGTKISTYRPLFIAVINAKFKELFQLLDSLDGLASRNLLLMRAWPSVRLTFRQTGYQLYLSSVIKVSGAHLSKKLVIPQSQLIREVNNYIQLKKLEFIYDEDTDIFESSITNKREQLVNSLQQLTEDSDNAENIIRERLQLLSSRLEPV